MRVVQTSNPEAPTDVRQPVSGDDSAALARYRRAANYLAAAQIYLKDNVLLAEPLRPTTSRTACSAIGGRARASISSTPTSTGWSASATRASCSSPDPGTARPPTWPTSTSRDR